MAKIFPSILAGDLSRLAEEVRAVEEGGADGLHLDVMDGHFVPNLTFGPEVIQALRPQTALFFDTHLMISNPDDCLESYRKAGADSMTVHAEVCSDLSKTLREIKRLGAQAGVALNPETPLSAVEPYLSEIDLLLVMTVNPGWAGQSFMEEVVPKIREARQKIDRRGLPTILEVDGGIKLQNFSQIVSLGPDWIVSGSGIFATSDYKETLAAMRRAVPPSPRSSPPFRGEERKKRRS